MHNYHDIESHPAFAAFTPATRAVIARSATTTVTVTTQDVRTVLTPGMVVTLHARHGAAFTGVLSMTDNARGEVFLTVPGFTTRLSPVGIPYPGATSVQVTL